MTKIIGLPAIWVPATPSGAKPYSFRGMLAESLSPAHSASCMNIPGLPSPSVGHELIPTPKFDHSNTHQNKTRTIIPHYMCTLTRDSIHLGDTAQLPKELVDFARRQVVNAIMYKGDQRKREDRQPILLQVRAVAVDEENQPIGQPFNLITRDISANTIGLIYTEPLEAERLVVHFSIAGTDVTLVTETVWSGSLGPFYGYAGRYIDRLEEFPAAYGYE